MGGAQLLPLLLLYLVLIGLPAAAAALGAARLGVSSLPLLLGVALAGSAASGMLAFGAYLWEPGIGEAFSYLLAFGSAGAVALLLYERRIPVPVLRGLAVPLALWAFGSTFLLFLGFMHGGTDHAVTVASTRFTGQLPSDNEIPHFYAEWFFAHGHLAPAPIYPPDWLSSDRPPLQVGYVLAVHPFGWDHTGLRYEVVGLVLQQLWIVGLWALLLAAGLARRTRALAMVAVLASDVAIVNGFFVWPKLLPAALLLAAAAIVLTPLWKTLRGNLWAAALFAALCGLAMMGHGASVFAILPLLVVAALRGLPSWRWVGVAVLVGAVTMAPWSAYQKYEDPPGNRLTKWMLAGVTKIDDRGTVETIEDSYREAGFGGALHYKAENVVTIAGGGPMAHELASWSGAPYFDPRLNSLRAVLFLNLLPGFGLFLLAPLAMAYARWRRPRAGPEWRFGVLGLGFVALATLIWGLLLFGDLPSRAVTHAGSLAVPIIGFAAAVAGLRAVYPRFAVGLVATQVVLMLLIYVPALTPEPGSSVSPLCLVLAALGLLGFGWVGWREGGPGEAAAAESEPTAAPADLDPAAA